MNEYNEQVQETEKIVQNIKIHDKYLSLVFLNDNYKIVNDSKSFHVYHLVLENTDMDGQYGIYIGKENTILCETMSIAYYKKIMNKIEIF